MRMMILWLVVLCCVGLVVLHLRYQWKQVHTPDIYEVTLPTRTHWSNICDLRSPVVGDMYAEDMDAIRAWVPHPEYDGPVRMMHVHQCKQQTLLADFLQPPLTYTDTCTFLSSALLYTYETSYRNYLIPLTSSSSSSLTIISLYPPPTWSHTQRYAHALPTYPASVLTLTANQVVYVPPYWWYRIDQGRVLQVQYTTYMSALAEGIRKWWWVPSVHGVVVKASAAEQTPIPEQNANEHLKETEKGEDKGEEGEDKDKDDDTHGLHQLD